MCELRGAGTWSCNANGFGHVSVDRVVNYDIFTPGRSNSSFGAFPSPYTGVLSIGYKMAQYRLGYLDAGYQFNGVNSGSIPCSQPSMYGTWYVTIALTECTGIAIDNGYEVADFRNTVANRPVAACRARRKQTSSNLAKSRVRPFKQQSRCGGTALTLTTTSVGLRALPPTMTKRLIQSESASLLPALSVQRIRSPTPARIGETSPNNHGFRLQIRGPWP